MPKGIDKLIINSPYTQPNCHWEYNRDSRSFELAQGRRKAGFVIASPDSQSFDDPGIFKEIELVNKIRPRVDLWRAADYPGVTGVTKRLLEHWHDSKQRNFPFFFCQLEAIETLIWLTEAPESEKVGINIPGDGGEFRRLCSKMGTGSGKTTLMAMIIAWNIVNKITYTKDTRFSSNILIVAPNITVKNRLQVLVQDHKDNYYDNFQIVPESMREFFRRGTIVINNWHQLMPLEDDSKKKSVVKKGPESDVAFVNRVLGHMARRKNILVINDEAHHAWRMRPELKISKKELDERQEDSDITRWIEGLDRIHKTIGVLTCFDVSATPFAPTGKKTDEEGLFDWIVSDFGLNDAIESGLVKTPRVAIKDDGTLDKNYKSKFYHMYPHVREDLQKADETDALPDLVMSAYNILGSDWRDTFLKWNEGNSPVPPVLLTVCNLVDTAKRIEYSFANKKIQIEELCDTEKMIRVDSSPSDEIDLTAIPLTQETEEESSDGDDSDDKKGPKISKKDLAIRLRRKIDTVGKPEKEGSHIRNVISVAMISEGWDAQNVTHIMGLRAFSSQLLCEQVIGRGLRRMSYELNQDTGLMNPEYVNIFGIPFTFIPFEGGDGVLPPPPKPKTFIEVVNNRQNFEIKIPHIDRIDSILKSDLILDEKSLKPITLSVRDTPTLAEVAPVINGKPDYHALTEINLNQLAEKYRYQKIVFEVARDVIDRLQNKWEGSREDKILALFGLIEKFVTSDKIIFDDYDSEDVLRKRLLITLNMRKIVEHLSLFISNMNRKEFKIIYNQSHPIISTFNMNSWWSSKPCIPTQKSQISHVVCDSTWEARVVELLERNPKVVSYVKNDHIGLFIYYYYQGKTRKYIPDLIIKLDNGKTLILEVKGQGNEQVDRKNEFMDQWVQAVNQEKRWGEWVWDILYDPMKTLELLKKHS